MAKKPNSIDEYLAALPDDQRKVLEGLRRAISSAAPHAEECISYGVPAFRQDGMLVGFGAAAKHCSLFLMSGSMVQNNRELLRDYDTSKGAIRFTAAKSLPAGLVKKLVKLRIAENEARQKKKKSLSRGVRPQARRGTKK